MSRYSYNYFFTHSVILFGLGTYPLATYIGCYLDIAHTGSMLPWVGPPAAGPIPMTATKSFKLTNLARQRKRGHPVLIGV